VFFKKPSERAPFAPDVEVMVDEDGERWDGPFSFTLSWSAADWGFGMFSFSKREEGGGLECGDEYMGLENVTRTLAIFCEKTPMAEWPEILREYGSVERLMADVLDWESKPREASKD
jgi:hypothetical protein